ncbi:MAG: tyrosine-protein phosphatase [Gemmatales bacterium]
MTTSNAPWKRWLRTLLFLVAFFTTLEIVRITAGPNWHTIVSGELYRSAHLSSSEIQSVAHRFGIRSIINLRNCCPWEPWYQNEGQAVDQLQLQRVDLNFSAYIYPAPQELQKLFTALETSPRPLFIHCRRGADRTGLASVIASLYENDGNITVDDAEYQLSLFKGHTGVGRVEVMGDVVDMYRSWLRKHDRTHSRANLKQWIFEDYRPGFCYGSVEAVQVPRIIHAGEPELVRVKLTNRSHTPWQFSPASNVGIHLRGYIEPAWIKNPPWADPFEEKPYRKNLAAGFLKATVQPDESIELDVAIPAIREPGKYRLLLDLYDEAMRCSGDMVGSKAFKTSVEITSASVAQR